IPIVLPQTTLLQADLSDLSTAENRLVMQQQQLGKENPEVITTAKAVEDINKRIDARVEGILDGVKTRVKTFHDQLDDLEAQVKAAKTYDQERAGITQPYFDKKHDLDDLYRERGYVSMKLLNENSGRELPKILVEVP